MDAFVVPETAEDGGLQSALPPPGARVVAALPRSPLHLRFLAANAGCLDIVFYRDARLEPLLSPALRAKSLYLGREARPTGLSDLPAAIATNRRYYGAVRETLGRWSYDRFIIFLEGEPLETLIQDVVGAERMELWEEGLGHYLDFHGPVYNALRGLAQAASGFYPRRAPFRRARRARFARVRDRFAEGSLRLDTGRPTPARQRDAVLFIGAPLVQDAMLSRRRYLAGLEAVVTATRFPVVYYPHPREDTRLLAELVAAVGSPWFEIAQPEGDVAEHCARCGYRAYLSVLSTALLETPDPARSAYLPGLFGLSRAQRALARLPFLPLPVLDTRDRLAAFLRAVEPRPSAAGAAPAAEAERNSKRERMAP